MKLSIIIVSYNVCDYLRQCLNSIYSSVEVSNIEVIVVDNYSFDNTSSMIGNEFKDVQYIQNKENVGFSKAVNIGAKYAKGKYVCFLNPDTLVEDTTFNILIKYLQLHPEVGCIGPKILNSDGSFQLTSKRSFPYPLIAFFKLLGFSKIFPNSKLFGRYNLTYLNENEIHQVDALSGSFMLMRHDIYLKIGKFDENYFMYGEDIDYCYRIQESGLKLVYNPETTIIHYKGESVKSSPLDMVQIFYSAMNIFYHKYSNNFPSWKYIRIIVLLGIQLRKCAAYLSNYTSRITAWIFDSLLITMGFVLSVFIWYPFYYNETVSINSVINQFPLLLNMIVSWLISAYFINLYKKDYLSYGRSIVTSGFALLIAATSTYFIGIIAYSRVVLLGTIIFSSITTSIWRIFFHLLYYYRKINTFIRTPLFSRRAAIIGTDIESMRIGNLLNNQPGSHFNLMGYIDYKNKSKTKQFIGRLEDVSGIIRNHHINEIVIPEKWGSIGKLINLLHEIKDLNISCKLVPKGKKMLIGKGVVENLSGVPLIDIEFPLYEKFHQSTKRTFDILFSILIIVLTLPIHMYKLLSAKVARTTIWSKDSACIIIYKYKSAYKWIQDLPLLFNIFSGSMSFVGSHHVDINSNDPKFLVKPGLTGLFQLKTSHVSKESIREYEQHYAMHYSLIFDIEIILKSILRF